MNILLRNRLSFFIIHNISKIYYFFLIHFRLRSNKKLSYDINNLKILLIYSKSHYDPNLIDLNEMVYTGTAYWARWLYSSLLRFGVVDYIDSSKNQEIRSDYDLIVGLNSKNYCIASRCNPKAFKILVAVNSHPLYRNEVLLKEANFFNVRMTSEIVNPFMQSLNIANSNKILLTGNNKIAETYFTNYIKKNNLFLIQGFPDGVQFPNHGLKKSTNPIKIVYPSGQIGLRKGLLRFLIAWPIILSKNSNIELTIIGKIEPEISRYLNNQISKYRNVKIVDWFNHHDYINFLNEQHLVVLLSWEEGQVFSVLEAISCGCSPIISQFCGFDLPKEYVVDDIEDPFEIADKVNKNISRVSGSYNVLNKQHDNFSILNEILRNEFKQH